MPEHRVQVEREIAAPPQTVWEVVTDLDHAAETLSGVTRIEVLTDGPYAVGTRWRETRRMMGKEETQELQVTEVDAPRRTTVEAESDGVHYVSTLTVTPTASGTHLLMTFAADQPHPSRWQRLAWAALGGLGLRLSRRVMARDLDDIARRAETA